MTTLRDIGVSALINIVGTIFSLVGFMALSLQPMNARVYKPKLYLKGVLRDSPSSTSRNNNNNNSHRYFETDFRQYLWSFSWVAAALRMPEENLIEHAGLDSVVYLRIYLLGLKVFVPMTIIGMVVLVTVNVGAGFLDDNATTQSTTSTNTNGTASSSNTTQLVFSGIDKLSISNIPDGSPRLWCHLIVSYIFTAWTCYMLYLEYRTITNMRRRFQDDDHRRPDQFTVLVQQVPRQFDESIHIQVDDYFKRNHPEYYLTHQLVYNANKLSKFVRKRERIRNWLAFSQLKLSREATTPTTRAEAERLVILDDPKRTMPAAFVSFKSRWGAAVCAQTQQNSNPTVWLTQWAPEPRDVNWKNLAIPNMQLTCRRVFVNIGVFLIVFFFLVPVALVQSLASLTGIQSTFPWLSKVLQQQFFASFIQGFLPGFILKIFTMVIPYLVTCFSAIEGHVSLSRLETTAATKFYYFVVINVFFGSILTGSAFSELQLFVDQSSLVGFLKTLAVTIPMKASFFITYVMVDGWAGPAFEILRVIPLVSYHLLNSFFVKTEGDKIKAMSPGTISLSTSLPQLELYFLMGLVYSVITPLILPFIVITFLIGFIVYRHQVINVYDAPYESAGGFWPHVHGHIIAALIIEHLTLIGLFLIQGPISFGVISSDTGTTLVARILQYCKQALSSTPFIVALPIFTMIFHNQCKKRFEPAFKRIPLEMAVKKDLEDKAKEPRFNLAVFLRNAYKHPDFSDEIDNTPDVEAANKSPTIEDNLSEASSSQPEIPNKNQLSGEESTSTPQEATLEDQSTLKNDDTKSVLDEQNA
ncbi:unnamed protein product [Sphagnum compactum]